MGAIASSKETGEIRVEVEVMTRRQHRPALSIAFALLAIALTSCEVGGHAESSEPFRISSLITSETQSDDKPHLTNDLSTNLTLVLSQQDANTLMAPTEIPYSAVTTTAAGIDVTGLGIETDLRIATHDDGFRFCLADDVAVRENDTDREHILVRAGTCTERPRGKWDATAQFAQG